MIYLINVPRHTLIVSVLLILFLFSPIAVAKHIIVIYDVSGSMISLRIRWKGKHVHGIRRYPSRQRISDKPAVYKHFPTLARYG